MEQFITWKDFVLTPFYFVIFYGIARSLADSIKDRAMRKYFLPAYLLKMSGGVAVGLVYQYYYGGGYDTYYYFIDGTIIYEAFLTDTMYAFELIFGECKRFDAELNPWSGRLAYWDDPPTYMISRFSGFFGIFTFATYSVTALFFATFSFYGSWQMYRVFCHIYPHMKKEMAIACFFFPSVFFWGSGVLKDSITFGCLGLCVYGFYFGFLIKSKKRYTTIAIFFIAVFLLKSIKIYILMCLIPSLAYWAFSRYAKKIDNGLIRFMSGPFFIVIFGVASYMLLERLVAGTEYDLNNIAKEIKITSDYLRKISKEGSFYYFGELDGTFNGMLQYYVPAVLTTLYRPGIWEARNPLMIIAALENGYLMVLTIAVFIRTSPIKVLKSLGKEEIVPIALIFTLSFSFFVGLASANFGTLVRYKIPMMPFYIAFVYVVYQQNFVLAKRKSIKAIIEKPKIEDENTDDTPKTSPEQDIQDSYAINLASFRRNVKT